MRPLGPGFPPALGASGALASQAPANTPPAGPVSPAPLASAEGATAPGPAEGSQRPRPPGAASDARLRAAREEEAQRAHLLPLPSTPRDRLSPALFEARLAPGTDARPLLSENDVPMTSMVLNSGRIRTPDRLAHDGLAPSHLARAAVTANPDIQLIVPTRAAYDGAADPRFGAERRRIAESLGVPVANVLPVRADMAAFPQDELMAGVLDGRPTLVRPALGPEVQDTYRRPRADDTTHWNRAQTTRFGAADLAGELGIGVARGDMIARGGDTHVVTRPDGAQAAFFSAETVRYAAASRGLELRSDQDFLRGLDVTMRGLRAAGIPLDRVAPLGRGTTTYGQALAGMSPEERGALDPEVRARFEALAQEPLPTRPYAYHADLSHLTLDGRTMFVNDRVAAADPALERQLRRFGYEPVRLPSVFLPPGERQGPEGQGLVSQGMALSYMNSVVGRDRDGRRVLLMPTEALDPARLTPRDEAARAVFQAVHPELRVVPIGGRSAWVGAGRFDDGYRLDRDFGPHCLTNVLPFEVRSAEGGPSPRRP